MKATRLNAVLQYASRLANVGIGFAPYLFKSEDGGQFISPPDEDGVYRKADGDGRVMPAFSPFLQGEGSSIPFHPHVSA